MAAGVLGLLSNFDALDATVLLVDSFDGGFLAMMVNSSVLEDRQMVEYREVEPRALG